MDSGNNFSREVGMHAKRSRQSAVFAAFVIIGSALSSQAALPFNQSTWKDIAIPGNDWYFGITAIDLRHDGYKDIICNKNLYINPRGTGANSMTGTWQKIALNPNVNIDCSLAFDMDGDGEPEIFGEALPNVYMLKEHTKGSWTQWDSYIVQSAPAGGHGNGQGWVIGDFDPTKGGASVKLPEILIACENNAFYYFTIATNPASQWTRFTVSSNAPNNQGVDAADLDGDGFVDCAANYADGNNIAWYKNPGNVTGTWTPHAVGRTVQPLDRMIFCDLNNDGKLDIAYSESEANGCQVGWMENPGDPTKPNWVKHVITTQDGTYSLRAADFDLDGNLDLVTGETTNKHVRFWRNGGKGNFTQVAAYSLDAHHSCICADLDGDGDSDVIVDGWFDQTLHVLRNDGIPANCPKSVATKLQVLPEAGMGIGIRVGLAAPLSFNISLSNPAQSFQLLNSQGMLIDQTTGTMMNAMLRAKAAGSYIITVRQGSSLFTRNILLTGCNK